MTILIRTYRISNFFTVYTRYRTISPHNLSLLSDEVLLKFGLTRIGRRSGLSNPLEQWEPLERKTRLGPSVPIKQRSALHMHELCCTRTRTMVTGKRANTGGAACGRRVGVQIKGVQCWSSVCARPVFSPVLHRNAQVLRSRVTTALIVRLDAFYEHAFGSIAVHVNCTNEATIPASERTIGFHFESCDLDMCTYSNLFIFALLS